MPIDYTTLSLADLRAGLGEVARDVQTTFGSLDASQLNWRPDATRWSVAQCLDHLLATNALMIQAADAALAGTAPASLWRSLPVWPRLLGRMMIRSQAPTATRKFKAPASARPAASDIAADVVERFVAQHRDAVAKATSLDERRAATTIMPSPFARVVTYSVLDGWRLLFAHDRRHVEQARRVTTSPGFPAASTVPRVARQ